MAAMVDRSGRGVVLYLHVPSCHGGSTGSICSVRPSYQNTNTGSYVVGRCPEN
jgi:hypothetical protein